MTTREVVRVTTLGVVRVTTPKRTTKTLEKLRLATEVFMPDLGGFSERGQNRGQPQPRGCRTGRPSRPLVQRQPKGPPSRDRCPAGWDADIWHLVLRFEQYARADKIELTAGRPVIYMEITDLVSRYGMRAQDVPPGGARLRAPAARHRHGGALLVPLAAREARRPGGRADHLGPEGRDHHGRAVVPHHGRVRRGPLPSVLRRVRPGSGKHWRSLRIVKSIDEQPKEPRRIMRRVTMPADSKEG